MAKWCPNYIIANKGAYISRWNEQIVIANQGNYTLYIWTHHTGLVLKMIPVSGTHRFLRINPSFIYVAEVDVIYVTERNHPMKNDL